MSEVPQQSAADAPTDAPSNAPSRDPFAVPGSGADATPPTDVADDSQPAESGDVVADAAGADAAGDSELIDLTGDSAEADASAADAGEEAGDEPAVAVDESAEDESAEEDEDDPVTQLRESLRTALGDWYVVHSYAGYENRVKTNIESRTSSMNMEDYIFQVEVPTEEVVEIKNNQRKNVKRNKFPGYVLVRMDLNDTSWGTVRNTPGVTGFVGHGHAPTPLTIDEVVAILAPKPEKKAGSGGGAAPTEVRVLDFSAGDSVTIIGEHAFAGLLATIDEVHPDSKRVKAFVEIFGRETPVELEFSNIQKN